MRIKLIDEKYKPEYKTFGAAGADLRARGNFDVYPGKSVKIPLGVCFEIPVGYEIQIRPRSGLSAIGIMCSFGTVDSDYRGEVCAVITNVTNDPYFIKDGDRVCQMVYSFVTQIEFEQTDELSQTERGSNGFGSTGIQ